MQLTASDRSAMIRLAASLPKGSEERRAILSSIPKIGRWYNYNTQGTREFISGVLEMMGSLLPATLSYLPDSEPEFPKILKKWKGKGSPYKAKGIQGLRVRWRGATLFMGRIGRKNVIIKDRKFKIGKLPE